MSIGRTYQSLICVRHFEQAKGMGYRPGLSKVSDQWVSIIRISNHSTVPSLTYVGDIILHPLQEHSDRSKYPANVG